MFRMTTLVLLISSTSLAWAQDDALTLPTSTISAVADNPDAAPSGVQLDRPIKTGSRLGLTARETPASVSVADRDVIEARGAKDTHEVINGMTGINASANPGYGGFVAYRGFTQNQITQLFNGIDLGYSSSARPIDAWTIDRVELIGGPSTFLYGAGAVGGSINYISKLASRDEQILEGRVRYGTYDDRQIAWGFNQALGGPEARNFLRLDYSHAQNNGFIDRNERKSNSVAVSLLSDLSGRLSHTLALEYQEDYEDSPYWGSPILNTTVDTMKLDKSRRFNNYNAADGVYQQRVRWIRSITEYRFDEDTSLQNTLYNYSAVRNYRNIESASYSADNREVIRSGIYMQRHQHQLLGNRLEVTHRTSLLGLDSQWAGGLDYSMMRLVVHPDSSRYSATQSVDPDHFDPGSFHDLSGFSSSYRKQRKHESSVRALFLENRLDLTEKLSLLTGLRYDHLQMEVTNYGTVTAGNPAFFKRTWEPLSGRIGLMYAFSPTANAYVQYSTSADMPAGSLAAANYSNVGMFDLSTGEQWEVGSKFDFLDGRASATTAVYQIVRRDFAARDWLNPMLTVQAGQQTSRGIELSGKLHVTPRLLAEVNYAYVDAQFDDFNESVNGASVSRKGKTPSNVPDSVANLWLTYSLTPAIDIGADVRYVDSVYADNANTLKADGYTLFGAFARYRVDEHMSVTVRARNLTDEIYAAQASSGNQYYMGAPRTFDVALDLRF